MVNHVFFSSYSHLNLSLIEGLFSISKTNDKIKGHYIIIGKGENLQKYLACFEEYGIDNYIFINNIFEFLLYIIRNREQCYLLHGIPYAYISCFIIANAKNVNWVCWGAGARINRNNPKSILFTPLKMLMYKKFSMSITLLTGDKISLEKDYKLKNVKVLPYYSEKHLKLKDYFISLLNSKIEKKGRIKVLLGNNAWCLSEYYKMLQKLSCYKESIQINCMLQYPQISVSIKNDFIHYGNNIYGDNFAVDERMLNTKEYIEYINSFDIYICPCNEQSGLGAISTCLKLGKKVYLSGVNYEWIHSQGFQIYHIDNILDDDFLHCLNDEIKDFNFFHWYKTRETLKDEWILFLGNIC